MAFVLIYLHFLTLGRTLGIASMTISYGNSIAWQHLTLTGISARRVVIGKWVAILRLRWKSFVLLGVARGVYTLPLLLFLGERGTSFSSQTEPPDDILLRYGLAILAVFALTPI